MIISKTVELLEKKNIKATDLVRNADISYGTAWRLVKDTEYVPSMGIVDKVCNYLLCDIQDVVRHIPNGEK